MINGAGQVAFLSDLDASSSGRGLFAGIVIDVDPGVGVDNRTVTNINYLGGSGGQDSRAMSFNDSGMLVYRLGFTDGSQGVFTSVVGVPEPGSLLLLATAGLAAGAWLRQRHPAKVARAAEAGFPDAE